MNKELLALYETWGQKFVHAKQTPMSEEVSRLFIACSLGEGKEDFPPQAVQDNVVYRIFMSRCDQYGLKVTKAVATLITVLSEGKPGTAVMYAAGLRYGANKDAIKIMDLDGLVRIFPMGYPDDKVLNQVWDDQKGHLLGEKFDNLLDLLGGDPYAV